MSGRVYFEMNKTQQFIYNLLTILTIKIIIGTLLVTVYVSSIFGFCFLFLQKIPHNRDVDCKISPAINVDTFYLEKPNVTVHFFSDFGIYLSAFSFHYLSLSFCLPFSELTVSRSPSLFLFFRFSLSLFFFCCFIYFPVCKYTSHNLISHWFIGICISIFTYLVYVVTK